MSQSETIERPVIRLSEQAASVIKTACDEQSASLVRFTIAVQGENVVHGISLERDPTPEDVVFEQHDLKMAVAKEQVPFLNGTEVDYRGEGQDGHFVVANPNLQESP